jgi:hypothetical protein
MAKGLVVRWNGESSAFGLSRLDRDKLYGVKLRVVVDENDRSCQSASLTADGSALIPSGGVSLLYVDDACDSVERSDLVPLTPDGTRAPLKPSTLGIPQDLGAPVPPSRVLETVVTHVYALSKDEVGPELAKALAGGAIFETRFNYRDDYADAPAFLLENAEGTFALVAAEAGFSFVERETVAAEDDGEGDAGDDLDFGMM